MWTAKEMRGCSERGEPLASRCSVGKNRWFWVAFKEYADDEPLPDAHGYEATAEAAEAAALAAAGPGACSSTPKIAKHYRERMAAEARMNRPASGAKDSARVEFLYHVRPYEYYVGDVCVTRHRIVGKTARRIYVEREPFREDAPRERSWYDYDVRTVVVDRATLEREGRHRAPRSDWYFYASEEAGRRDVERVHDEPEWALVLGLELPCSLADVKAAYRLRSKEVHPDLGGDQARFVEVERAYRDALRVLPS